MFVDLSQTIENGMITYDGLPAPSISDFLSRETSRTPYGDGSDFQIGRIDMVANTGTYVAAPSHRFASGPDIGLIALGSIADIPAVVLRAHGRKSIDAPDVRDL